MRIFVNQKDLDLISKLPNKIGLLGDQHWKTREDLYLSEALSNNEFVPIEVAADQNGCGWKTMVFKTPPLLNLKSGKTLSKKSNNH